MSTWLPARIVLLLIAGRDCDSDLALASDAASGCPHNYLPRLPVRQVRLESGYGFAFGSGYHHLCLPGKAIWIRIGLRMRIRVRIRTAWSLSALPARRYDLVSNSDLKSDFGLDSIISACPTRRLEFGLGFGFGFAFVFDLPGVCLHCLPNANVCVPELAW